MKNVRILLIALTVVFAGFSTSANGAENSDDKLIDDIKAYADSFEKALDIPNYRAAKESLDELFPLLKKEMKMAKKQINEVEKEGDAEMAAQLENDLKRKEEIHEKLHSIVDASSAGLRVRADAVRALVSEYVDLLATPDKLVSSNN
jgi:hypothetical protein